MKKFVKNNNKLSAVFTFSNFVQAVDFVNQVANLAERADHHPDILIHDYKKVTITLTTHEKNNSITKKDLELASQIEAL